MNKYEKGSKICEELFWKTLDPRYKAMKTGFDDIAKEKADEMNQENGYGM